MTKRRTGSQSGQFDSQPLKGKNRPKIHVHRWHATYHWKNFDEGYNFSLDFISIRDLNKKLWLCKMPGSNFENFGNLGVLGKNDIWM
jgi:hypothetical protein